MRDGSTSPMLRFLQGAACTVIVLWGVKAASPVLGPLLLGLLLAYAVVSFPKWLMRRFKFPKSAAIAMTGAVVVASVLCLMLSLDLASVRIKETLPIYEQHLASLHEQVAVSMSAHGIDAPIHSVKNVLTPERLREITGVVLTVVRAIVSMGLLISLLAFLFHHQDGGWRGQSKRARRAHELLWVRRGELRGRHGQERWYQRPDEPGVSDRDGRGNPGRLELPVFLPRLYSHSGLSDCACATHFRDAPHVWLEEGPAGGLRPDLNQLDRRQRCDTNLHEAGGGRLFPRDHAVARGLDLPPRPDGRHRRGPSDNGLEKVRSGELEIRAGHDGALRVTFVTQEESREAQTISVLTASSASCRGGRVLVKLEGRQGSALAHADFTKPVSGSRPRIGLLQFCCGRMHPVILYEAFSLGCRDEVTVARRK